MNNGLLDIYLNYDLVYCLIVLKKIYIIMDYE